MQATHDCVWPVFRLNEYFRNIDADHAEAKNDYPPHKPDRHDQRSPARGRVVDELFQNDRNAKCKGYQRDDHAEPDHEIKRNDTEGSYRIQKPREAQHKRIAGFSTMLLENGSPDLAKPRDDPEATNDRVAFAVQ